MTRRRERRDAVDRTRIMDCLRNGTIGEVVAGTNPLTGAAQLSWRVPGVESMTIALVRYNLTIRERVTAAMRA